MSTDRPISYDSLRWLVRAEGADLRHIAMPVGGIGTGCLSLGGRGDLRDWEIGNRPAKRFQPPNTFLALRLAGYGIDPMTRVLQGPLGDDEYQGAFGSQVAAAGLPRFRDATFEATYPIGRVTLKDPNVPVTVQLVAFNPLVPADVEGSSLPLAVVRVLLHSRWPHDLEASVAFSLQNFIGTVVGTEAGPGTHLLLNEPHISERLNGVLLSGMTGGPHERDNQSCEPGLASIAVAVLDGHDVSRRTAFAELDWGDALLDYWEDLHFDGLLTDAQQSGAPVAAVCERTTIEPGASAEITFLVGWHFPRRLGWSVPDDPRIEFGTYSQHVIGNSYTERQTDAWTGLISNADRLPTLEKSTVEFLSAVTTSDIPAEILEAATSTLSTLRTQTCFISRDGRFWGWEGTADDAGSCFGNCTHVWNYEHVTSSLFGPLARSLRDTEFRLATDARGHMAFRVLHPVETMAHGWPLAAADGQCGCIVKLYRDWRLSGAPELLSLWPHARRAMEFCWIAGGWDADQDGVMEGVQHNTMDVEYFGPNPQMQIWYLAALRAASRLSAACGDVEFADRCRQLADSGAAWTSENLFNGEYFEQQIRPLAQDQLVASGLMRVQTSDELRPEVPAHQVGAGCLIDQTVGQVAAHLSGLGYVLPARQIGLANQAVVRHNHRSTLADHFNHMRSFALQDEAATLMCAYPHGARPDRPFPYYNEAMTGFEYTVAIALIQEGFHDEGLKVIAAVRARHTGRRRNPFNEPECGHHYVRSMASWGAIVAWTGFGFDHAAATLTLRPEPEAKWFFSTGDAWGIATQLAPVDASNLRTVRIELRGGVMALSAVDLAGYGTARMPRCVLHQGDEITVAVEARRSA